MYRLFERAGYAAQWLTDNARTLREQANSIAGDVLYDGDTYTPDDGSDRAGAFSNTADTASPEPGLEPEHDAALSSSVAMLASTAGAWLLGRALRPNRVNWSRAVVAGVAGTLLYDAVMIIDQRVTGRKLDTIQPLGEAVSDDPEIQRWAGWALHYAAGIGLAVFYARYIHGRVDLPRSLQGAAFGAADAVLLEWGGLLPLISQAVPDVPLPAGYAGLAQSPELTAQSLARHIAYGTGVGIVYNG